MKQTIQSANGTSFHGTVIKTTVEKLKQVCGEPRYVDNSGTDKVNFDWVMETEDGDVFTIYDWKEYRPISETELIEFHIGGHGRLVTNIAKEELEEALNKL